MKATVKVEGELLNEVKVLNLCKDILWKTVHKAEELAVSFCPVDQGTLKGSIRIYPRKWGKDEYFLSDGVEYGQWVEYGTSPHAVPVEALEGWAKRKLGDKSLAEAVAWKIRRYGTPAQPFLRPARDIALNVFLPIMVQETLEKHRKV